MDNRAGPILAEERQERKEDYEKRILIFEEQIDLFIQFLLKENLLDRFKSFIREKEQTTIREILKKHPPKIYSK